MAESEISLLIVEPDDAFYSLVKASCENLGIPIQRMSSIAEFKEFNGEIRGLIVSGSLQDGSGMELLEWVRESNKYPDQYTALITVGYVDSENFADMKKLLKVDFVINKPIESSNLKSLLELLYYGDKKEAKESLEKDPLNEVKKKYEQSFFQKLGFIEDHIAKVKGEGSKESLQELQELLHKMAGSAGSYGHMEVSKLCKNQEEEVSKQLSAESIDPKWVEKLEAFFRELTFAFQVTHDKRRKISSSAVKEQKKSDDPLEAIKQEYLKKVDEKITTIDELIKKVQSDPNAVEELKKAVHKIAGSAGSYGFPEVTKLCKEQESLLLSVMENGENREQVIGALPEFFEKFKAAFQMENAPAAVKTPEKTAPKKESIAQEYAKSIEEKTNYISQLIDEVIANPSVEKMKDLRKYLHKIAGSAGSYGYMKVSKVAKRVENEMRDAIDNFDSMTFDEAWKNSLINAKAEIIEGFSITPTGKEEVKKSEVDFMDDLRAQYQKSIPEKVAKIDSMISNLETTPSDPELEDLKVELHKISGSAGSYGYHEVSIICKAIVNDLLDLIPNIEALKSNPDFLVQLRRHFDEIKAAYESPTVSKASQRVLEGIEGGDRSSVDLYILDDDEDFIALVEQAAQSIDLRVELQSSAQAALERFEAPDFSPQIILIDKNLGDGITGYDVIKKFKEQSSEDSKTILGLISASGEIPDRLQAVSLGVELFLQKPISPEELLKHVENLITEKIITSYRLMLVDDDVDFCDFIAFSLRKLKIEVKAYNEGQDLFERLNANQPDLLLLDIDLPDYNGLDLLESTRADLRYNDLPIFLITSHDEPEFLERAFDLGIDDFITKPLNEGMLKVRIKNFMKHQRIQDNLRERDQDSGLFNRHAVVDFFTILSSQHQFVSVALLDLTIPPDAENTAGLVNAVSSLLNPYFRSRDIIGLWREQQFIVIFPDLQSPQVTFLIKSFFDEIQGDELFRTTPGMFLSVGVVDFPNDGIQLQELMKKANELLQTSHERGQWAITAKPKKREEDIEARPDVTEGVEVLIAGADQDIIKMISYAYELRGFKLSTFNEGGSAVQWLEQNVWRNPPDLIVLDTNLPDMEGFELLEKIKTLGGTSIPIMLLSSMSQEENTIKGLAKGANEYIAKPFSLTIFMEKTLHLLSL
ncbi:MAG: response regulator [Simkaniaceae bacterium]|nr:response regulator [Simkaniaceae bacterium]